MESTVTPATRLRPCEDLQVNDAVFHGQFDPLGGITTPTATSRMHATTLNRAIGSQPTRAGSSLLRLQRRCGNRYVQRVLALARQEESPEGFCGREFFPHQRSYAARQEGYASVMIRRQDNGQDGDGGSLADKPKTPFPPDLPDTRYCTFDLASGKWNCCAEVAQGKVCLDDWGKFKDWLKGQQAPGKAPCPTGQSISPVGCCPQGQTWDGTKCSAPAAPSPGSCPPEWRTPLGLKCCPPPLVPGSFDCETPQLVPPEAPAPQPGDYNVPDESDVAVA